MGRRSNEANRRPKSLPTFSSKLKRSELSQEGCLPFYLRFRVAIAATLFNLIAVSSVLAAPQGGSVVGGASTITGTGTGAVQIDQSTQRSIIDWRSYSIGVGESVTYRQPNASAISLNRVTGGIRLRFWER